MKIVLLNPSVRQKLLLFAAMASALLGVAATLPLKEPRQTEEQAQAQLAAFASTWHRRAGWEARAKKNRGCILREANLTPLPSRWGLEPIILGKQKRQGYSIE